MAYEEGLPKWADLDETTQIGVRKQGWTEGTWDMFVDRGGEPQVRAMTEVLAKAGDTEAIEIVADLEQIEVNEKANADLRTRAEAARQQAQQDNNPAAFEAANRQIQQIDENPTSDPFADADNVREVENFTRDDITQRLFGSMPGVLGWDTLNAMVAGDGEGGVGGIPEHTRIFPGSSGIERAQDVASVPGPLGSALSGIDTGEMAIKGYGGIGDELAGVTYHTLRSWMASLNKAETMSFQRLLLDTGYFEMAGDFNPQLMAWGDSMDAQTQAAFLVMIEDAAAHPKMNGRDLFNLRLTQYSEMIAAERQGEIEEALQGALSGLDEIFYVDSAASLRELGDGIAKDLLGRKLDDSRLDAIVAEIQGQQEGQQRAANDFVVGEAQLQIQDIWAGNTGPGADGVDAFMNAIMGNENAGEVDPDALNMSGSGARGSFQIMPDNWGPWAVQAGLPFTAEHSAENEYRIAKTQMLKLYRQFGNWRDVAIAWYAGGNSSALQKTPQGQAAGNAPQYYGGDKYPSIFQYADDIVSKMGPVSTGSGQGYAVDAYGNIQLDAPNTKTIEQVDADASLRTAIRAADPIGWETHEHAQNARSFFELVQQPFIRVSQTNWG